jgi:hypothetical protein
MVRVDAGGHFLEIEAISAAHDLTAAIALDNDITNGLAVVWAAGNVVVSLERRGPVAESVGFRHCRNISAPKIETG